MKTQKELKEEKNEYVYFNDNILNILIDKFLEKGFIEEKFIKEKGNVKTFEVIIK